MKTIIYVAVLGLAAALVGCKTLTPNDSLAIGYSVVQTASQDVDALYLAHVITQKQADAYATDIQDAKAALDVAAAAVAANKADAGNEVATAVAAINALNGRLATIVAQQAAAKK